MKRTCSLSMAAISLLGALPSGCLAAQEVRAGEAKHHHYKLIDIGTFGGSQSFVNPGSGNEANNYTMVLNSEGSVTGWAESPTPDPYPAFCFADCFTVHAFVWKNGAKIDLGALPGGASSAGNWISSNGLIAGLSQNGEIDPLIPGLPEVRATLWAHGRIIDLGSLPEGGFESIAAAVNSKGQVVGLATNTIPDPNSMVGSGFQTRAFIWQNGGAMQDLGTLGSGTNAQALLVNERGQVVGWSYLNSAPAGNCSLVFVTGSFIWDAQNGMRDLGSLGGTCTTASAVNNRGQVVGFSNLSGDVITHGFLWDRGSLQDLGGPLGGDSSGPFAMNERGEAVGFAFLPGNTIFHAVLWRHVGDSIDLGGARPDQCNWATSINAKTQVVGSSGDCTPAPAHVFLWEDGSMADLNALIPPNSPLFLELTETINDHGEIAGTGSDVNGNTHAFLAIPCDERHPDLEGCDYSLVEGSSVATARATTPAVTRAAPPKSTPSQIPKRIRAVLARRNRASETGISR